MTFNICHTILLRIIHTFIWCRVVLWTFAFRFLLKPSAIFLNSANQRKRMVERCRNDSKNLAKRPLHVGLQILEERISDRDVTRILMWCIAMGIPYVTLFDVKGYFKKNSQLVIKNLQERTAGMCAGSDQLVFQLEAPMRNGETSWEVIQKATSEASDKTRIALISSQDGRQDVIDSARKICHHAAEKQCKASDVDIPHLDKLLNELMVFPDPELIIQFGMVDSLLGFSPWKIRVTEIMTLPTHHNMDYHSFYNTLQSFSKTKQRFGK